MAKHYHYFSPSCDAKHPQTWFTGNSVIGSDHNNDTKHEGLYTLKCTKRALIFIQEVKVHVSCDCFLLF